MAALLLAGCNDESEETANFALAAPAGHCEQVRFESSPFTICRYDRTRHRLELILEEKGSPLRSLANLGAFLGDRSPTLAFAMNAGMYDEAGKPIGLYVEAGKQLQPINLRAGPGNFHLKPNGVFAVDKTGRVSITASDSFARKQGKVTWATQSGPMLVIAGKLHPKFDRNGQSRLVRNGVGVANGDIAYFALSEEGVSFGRFARLFRDKLDCGDALYLDGTVSSLWDPAAGRQDAYASLGPMVAVFKAESKRRP